MKKILKWTGFVVAGLAVVVAKSYSLEQFSRLMHEGVGVGDRTFELMTPTSKARFSHLKSEEIAAMHAYLQSRG